MKKLIMMLCVLALCVPAVAQMDATVLVGHDEVISRIGGIWGRVQGGFQVTGLLEDTGSRVDDYDWDETLLGGYAIYCLDSVPVYAGIHAVFDLDSTDDGAIYGPLVGLLVVALPGVELVGEVQYRMYAGILRDRWGQDDMMGFAGLRWRFSG